MSGHVSYFRGLDIRPVLISRGLIPKTLGYLAAFRRFSLLGGFLPPARICRFSPLSFNHCDENVFATKRLVVNLTDWRRVWVGWVGVPRLLWSNLSPPQAVGRAAIPQWPIQDGGISGYAAA